MSFLVDNPVVSGARGLGDKLPLSGDEEGNVASPSKSQPAVGIVSTAGEVLSPSGGVLGTVIKGSVDALVGKPVAPTGDVLGDDGQVIGEVQMVDLEQQDETNSDADSGIYGVMREYDNQGSSEPRQHPELQKKRPELLANPNPTIPSKFGRQGTQPGAPDTKTDAANTEIDAAAARPSVGVNPKIWPKQKKGLTEMESVPEPGGPFIDFPGAVVGDDCKIICNGEVVGTLVQGEAKALKGKKVDADGDVLDTVGNVVGKAKRREEVPESDPGAKEDRSVLAGKRVNKAGNVVDNFGMIFGRIVDGDIKRMVGRMCDKEGIVRSETGDELGKAELVPEGEREGLKEGPFAELKGCTVTKDGKVVTLGGDIVGRLVEGDSKKLFGRPVDEDGDVCDKNGNTLGHAERWEEPEAEKKGPMAGRRVNREGNVVDENGDLIGKLTTGELSICSGKEIDDDGDVIDSRGNVVGHTSLLADIPPTPEPVESPEEKEKREQMEQDKKLATQMATCIEQCLDKIRPICKMITQILDKAERTPKEELDEEDVVSKVKPLLEEGSRILNEANGVIRGLDPDGRIAANAKHKTAAREATPEEYRLADVLKELTGTVTECIENAKRKVEDMPHAKEELNPLWGLLTEPLFQILAAVGLLLSGVLGLVGRLLSGLGLGDLVNNLLGGLGLTWLLEGLGLKGVVSALTGKK